MAPKAEVAVLALQGDFAAHVRALERAGATAAPARTAKEVLSATHLVLPGGESTTMLKLLELDGLDDVLVEFHASGRPILATCAGVILAAREVRNPMQRSFGLLDAVACRNAYGRQLDSFTGPVACPALGEPPLDAVFIRAPVIRWVGPDVEVLAERETPVLVRQGNLVAATFHPELTDDVRLHRYFVELAEGVPSGRPSAMWREAPDAW